MDIDQAAAFLGSTVMEMVAGAICAGSAVRGRAEDSRSELFINQVRTASTGILEDTELVGTPAEYSARAIQNTHQWCVDHLQDAFRDLQASKSTEKG